MNLSFSPCRLIGSPHCLNYYWRTIAHNSLLVYDPNEDFGRRGYGNEGGQRLPNGRSEARNLDVLLAPKNGYRTGKVLAHGFGPDAQSPDYTLLQGDLTAAYSKKVRQVTRSFVFLNLRNSQTPAALIVFDRVISANPAFRKFWLLHAQEEPRIDSTSATVDVTQHGSRGRLTLDVLLPGAAVLTKVGGPGKKFWAFGQNYTNDVEPQRLARSSLEPGAWRLELSPQTTAEEDLFLNVMQISDRQTPARFPVRRMDMGERAGCIIEGPKQNWMVLLRKDSQRSREQVKFTLPGKNPAGVLITDMTPGQWSAQRDGAGERRVIYVNEDSGAAWLTGPAGNWMLSR